jgi:5-methyltetrahydropteroyltriglutamate--homocysteine methyltransferase
LIPTEPIGSIPRPQELIDGMAALGRGEIPPEGLQELQDRALRDTIERFEATGSPVISDGEQTKSSFATSDQLGL